MDRPAGQHYSGHYDTFDPKDFGEQPSQRMATFITVLSMAEEGGETIFPLEGPDGLKRLQGINYDACEGGLKIKGAKGDGVLFFSLHTNRTFDAHSLHGACPVKKGKKVIAVKWIRDQISFM